MGTPQRCRNLVVVWSVLDTKDRSLVVFMEDSKFLSLLLDHGEYIAGDFYLGGFKDFQFLPLPLGK